MISFVFKVGGFISVPTIGWFQSKNIKFILSPELARTALIAQLVE
jgi:hypothetical protein